MEHLEPGVKNPQMTLSDDYLGKTMNILQAGSKEVALKLIEGQAARIVELDYADGAIDQFELGRLGRKCGVAVLHRGQEVIIVQSIRALHDGLKSEKDTYRQRHLYCMFDLAACLPEEVKWVESRAAFLGDCILRGELLETPYNAQSWAH